MAKVNRRMFLSWMGMGAAACLLPAISVAAGADSTNSRNPNFLFLLSDDQGWHDVGWHDPNIPTPNLDRLRQGGVELVAHYTAPVCSPTRAGLLTGRYWSRFGITQPTSLQCLPDGTPTLASVLHEAGYRTGLVGKWHLGGVDLADKRPGKFGFDDTYGCLDGAAHPYTHEYTHGGRGEHGQETWHRNGELIDEQGHITDLIARESVQFIRQSKDRPFFLYVPFTAPHNVCLEPPEWLAKVPNIPRGRQHYAAMITHMDAAIGQIVDALQEAGVRENTMIVFASDNGGHLQYSGLNSPLRDGKVSVYEGGIRTIAVANWPGRIRAGVLRSPVCITDWMPTFCAMAGCTPAADLKWDGMNIWSMLQDPAAAAAAAASDRLIYCKGPQGRAAALRQGEWKLVVQSPKLDASGQMSGSMELYNLREDEAEAHDRAKEQPERTAALAAVLQREMARDNDSVCRHIGGNLP